MAVLRLDRPVAYRPHIRPICLPEGKGGGGGGGDPTTFPSAGTPAVVSGWGALRPRGRRRPVELQAADVGVVDSAVCERWHKSFANIDVGACFRRHLGSHIMF